MSSIKSTYLKKPSMRLNITDSLANIKNEVESRRLERERIHNIIEAKKSAKKSVKKSIPRNNGLPRPHTHPSVSSRSTRPVSSNMYNLMEKGTPIYRPYKTMRKKMTPIKENQKHIEESVYKKRIPTNFSEYFQNVSNEAKKETRQLNAEKRFGNYMLELRKEMNDENAVERFEDERVKSEKNQLRRKKIENQSTKYSVKAHRELLDSYMPVHQIFNRISRPATHKGRKSRR